MLLTSAGETFLGDVERVLSDLDRALGAVRHHVSVRLGFSWLLPDPWAQNTVTRFEEATGGTVTLVRSDDPLAALQQSRIDVALVRGRVTSPAVRVVHRAPGARTSQSGRAGVPAPRPGGADAPVRRGRTRTVSRDYARTA